MLGCNAPNAGAFVAHGWGNKLGSSGHYGHELSTCAGWATKGHFCAIWAPNRPKMVKKGVQYFCVKTWQRWGAGGTTKVCQPCPMAGTNMLTAL